MFYICLNIRILYIVESVKFNVKTNKLKMKKLKIDMT